MRILIYGVQGEGLACYYEIVCSTEVAGFLDYNGGAGEGKINGISILNYDNISETEFDAVCIVSNSDYKRFCRDDRWKEATLGREFDILKPYWDFTTWLGMFRYAKKKNAIRMRRDERFIRSICGSLYQNARGRFSDSVQNMAFRRYFQGELSRYQNALLRHMNYYKAETSHTYEAKWNTIRKKYSRVEIYFFRVSAIGEMITNFFMLKSENRSQDVLAVCIPLYEGTTKSANKALLDLFSPKINIVTDENIDFWNYVIVNHGKEICICQNEKYYRTQYKWPTYQIEGNEWCELSEEIINEGTRQKEIMGIKHPYVTFVARTAAYYNIIRGHDSVFSYRNMNFEDYQLAIQYIDSQGMDAVRMGRMLEPIEINGCIDYAGKYANDIMDIYLAANCEFMVGTSTGVALLPRLFGRPVLAVNMTTLSMGFGGSPYTSKDMYVPKKYYSRKKKRYLSLLEIAKLEAVCTVDGRKLEKEGVVFENNSPDEILEAVKEMYERLNGIWKVTEEEVKCMERYNEVYRQVDIISHTPKNYFGSAFPIPICYTFLKKNLYLLD